MKKLASIALASVIGSTFLFNQVKATDLVVAAGGSGGAYASIGAAIAAANAGDRIIVYPQTGGASYSEGTLTITKSLQILSANEGAYYAVDGQINITPATAGMAVSIIGMKLFTGGISATAAAPVGARCTINLLNDSLAQGSINFSQNNYNLTVASCHIQSNLAFRFGKILGNVIANGYIDVSTDASVNNPNDTVLIIGNKINFYYGSYYLGGITWASTSQYYSIQNNFITLPYPANNVDIGIYATTSKASSAGRNEITNNTVFKSAGYIYYGYSITQNALGYTEIQNNLQLGNIWSGGIAVSGGTFSVHYNMTNTASFSGFTNDGTNIAQTNTVLNSDGLNTNALSNTINGGNPDSAYVDINLTRNDVGCYGGSYTFQNFFPITSNDWARVMLVTAPRRVMVNGTISVKAVGFDK